MNFFTLIGFVVCPIRLENVDKKKKTILVIIYGDNSDRFTLVVVIGLLLAFVVSFGFAGMVVFG